MGRGGRKKVKKRDMEKRRKGKGGKWKKKEEKVGLRRKGRGKG